MRWRIPRFLPWTTAYPLPQDTAQALLDQEGECDNLGLKMDRFLAYESGRQGLSFVREFANRRALVPDFTPLTDLIRAYEARWHQLAEAIGAGTFRAVPDWRVIIGLGTHVPLEGGMTLHRVYGFPIIPASALKGVVRLYAEAVLDLPEAEVVHLFGRSEEQAERGDLIFLEAVPAAPPTVEVDVMNPHFVAYYGGMGNVPPADYLSPNPIYFLAVGQDSPFHFGVASASHDQSAVQQAVEWLKQALAEIGVGAKTAAGYGYWHVED